VLLALGMSPTLPSRHGETALHRGACVCVSACRCAAHTLTDRARARESCVCVCVCVCSGGLGQLPCRGRLCACVVPLARVPGGAVGGRTDALPARRRVRPAGPLTRRCACTSRVGGRSHRGRHAQAAVEDGQPQGEHYVLVLLGEHLRGHVDIGVGAADRVRRMRSLSLSLSLCVCVRGPVLTPWAHAWAWVGGPHGAAPLRTGGARHAGTAAAPGRRRRARARCRGTHPRGRGRLPCDRCTAAHAHPRPRLGAVVIAAAAATTARRRRCQHQRAGPQARAHRRRRQGWPPRGDPRGAAQGPCTAPRSVAVGPATLCACAGVLVLLMCVLVCVCRCGGMGSG
jgi:hypothetical protein